MKHARKPVLGKYRYPLSPWYKVWLSGQPLWEMSTTHIQACIALLEGLLEGKKLGESLIPTEYHHFLYRLVSPKSANRYRLMWICRFKRELIYRKNREYRGFVQRFIDDTGNRATTALVLADWLQDQSLYPVLERRLRKYANDLGSS